MSFGDDLPTLGTRSSGRSVFWGIMLVAGFWIAFVLRFSTTHTTQPSLPLELGEESHYVGRALEVLPAHFAPQTVDEAKALAPHLERVTRDAPMFGLGGSPVWTRLRVRNEASQEVTRRLVIEAPWLDHIDLFFESNGRREEAHLGDALPQAERPIAGTNFAIDHPYPQGDTDIWIRTETHEPHVLPIRLLAAEKATEIAARASIIDGVVYGFLGALVVYNVIIFATLRRRNQLLYALYISSFVLLNMMYTGKAYAWFWPHSPNLQQLTLMWGVAATSCLSLLFASNMLELRKLWPRAHRFTWLVCSVAALGIAIFSALQWHAALVRFGYTIALVCIASVLIIGVRAAQRKYVGGALFLIASCFGTVGGGIGAAVAMGWLPYNDVLVRAIELGMLVDATLLTLALGLQFRSTEELRIQAYLEARQDPLTRLGNRRALSERGDALWQSQTPVSAIALDIDNFKSINDRFGHAVGDQALRRVGAILRESLRGRDFSARCGGEEFVILLQETPVQEATLLAERIREAIAASPIEAGPHNVQFTASFGVYERNPAMKDFATLLQSADARLYRAKESGRNCVVSESLPPLGSRQKSAL